MKMTTGWAWRCGAFAHQSQMILALFVAGVLTGGTAATALDKDDIAIHGFGGWAYGITDANRYLIGDSEGRADNVQFSLNLTASPSPRFTIVTQVEWEQGADEIETELDYAFVQINLNKVLDLRLGRVKHPYGIYAETFDVGTLRPFYLLPQSIYGAQGITAEHYDGIGLLGRHHGERWGIEWDLYAGEFQGDIELPGPLTGVPDLFFESTAESSFMVDDVIGGRLNIFTPVDGLMFGFSAYDGSQIFESLGGGAVSEGSYTVYGVHAEFLNDSWSIRAEHSTIEVASGDSFKGDGMYLELARSFGEHWQIAVRFDDFDADLGPLAPIDLSMLPPFASQFFESQDLGFGINYWLSPALVIRLNFHRVEGNRFAFPDNMADIQRAFMTAQLDDETDLFVFGAQFSF